MASAVTGAATSAFFASYARSDNDTELISTFVHELTSRVRKKLGLGSDDEICFLDTDAIESGMVWEDRLADAVNRASVLVCFCSPTYVARPFCAKEFDVFRRRLQADSHDGRLAVVPIIWEEVELPKSLSRYQTPSMPKPYQAAGFQKLVALEDRVSLQRVIDKLADHIRSAILQEPELAPLPSRPVFSELAAWFDNPIDDGDDVVVLILHPDGVEWRVKSRGPTVGEIIDPILTKNRLHYRIIDVAAGAPQVTGDFRELLVIGEDVHLDHPLYKHVRADLQTRSTMMVTAVGGDSAVTADAATFGFPLGMVGGFKKAVDGAVATILVERLSSATTRTIPRDLAPAGHTDVPTLQGPS